MDFNQEVISKALMVFCVVLGWLGRELWSAVKKLREDLAVLSKEVSDKYVAKSEFRDALRELKDDVGKDFDKFGAMLDKIYNRLDTLFDRLDSKADKNSEGR